MLEEVSKKEIKKLYIKNLRKDFPRSERCPFRKFIKAYKKGKMSVYWYIEENVKKAYIAFSKTDKILMIQYFAVIKKERGKGIGTRALSQFIKEFSKDKVICLEIEDPNDSKDEEDKTIRIKRKKFYENVGLKVENGIKDYYFYIRYKLMTTDHSYNAKILKEEILKAYSQTFSEKTAERIKIKVGED